MTSGDIIKLRFPRQWLKRQCMSDAFVFAFRSARMIIICSVNAFPGVYYDFYGSGECPESAYGWAKTLVKATNERKYGSHSILESPI